MNHTIQEHIILIFSTIVYSITFTKLSLWISSNLLEPLCKQVTSDLFSQAFFRFIYPLRHWHPEVSLYRFSDLCQPKMTKAMLAMMGQALRLGPLSHYPSFHNPLDSFRIFGDENESYQYFFGFTGQSTAHRCRCGENSKCEYSFVWLYEHHLNPTFENISLCFGIHQHLWIWIFWPLGFHQKWVQNHFKFFQNPINKNWYLYTRLLVAYLKIYNMERDLQMQNCGTCLLNHRHIHCSW